MESAGKLSFRTDVSYPIVRLNPLILLYFQKHQHTKRGVGIVYMTVTTTHKPNPAHTPSFFQYVGTSPNFEPWWEAKPVSTVKPDNARRLLPRCP